MVSMAGHPALASSRQADLATAPFCAMCLDAGIVRPAEIADQIVARRGEVNSSPMPHHKLDQTSPLSFSIASTSVPLGTVALAQAQGRNCVGTEENFFGKAKSRHSRSAKVTRDAPSDDASA